MLPKYFMNSLTNTNVPYAMYTFCCTQIGNLSRQMLLGVVALRFFNYAHFVIDIYTIKFAQIFFT